MQNALGKILGKLSSNYGDDIARDIVGNYGDDIAKKGMDSFLGRTISGHADDIPTMVTYHGIPADKLKMAASQMDGYLVNPSIQNVDPVKNMGGDFGEIVLLGNKDMVNPVKPSVESFNRDIYSPRFPQIDDDGLIQGTKTFATPNTVSKYMNKQGTRGVEYNTLGLDPAVIASKNAKKFSTLRDIIENQGNLQQYDKVKKAINGYSNDLFGMVDDIHNKNMEHGIDYDTVMSDIDALLSKRSVQPSIGTDDRNIVDSFRKSIADLPTDYFETKVKRPVKINEFTGAILPEDFADQEVLDILARNDIPIVKRYNQNALMSEGNQNHSLKNALTELSKQDRFTTPYLLGAAGLLPTAGILGSLFGSDDTGYTA